MLPRLLLIIICTVAMTSEFLLGDECPLCLPEQEAICSRQPLLLTVEQAVAIALQQNPNLLSLQELANAAHQRSLIALSRWSPHAVYINQGAFEEHKILLSSIGPAMTNRPQKTFFNSQFSFRQIVISQELYYGIKLGKLDDQAVHLELLSYQNDLIFNVRRSFYNVVLAEDELLTQAERVANLFDGMKQEENKLKAGKATKYVYNQSKVAVANALSRYYNNQKLVKVAYQDLALLLGYDDGNLIKVNEKEIPVLTVPEIAEKIESLGIVSSLKSANIDEEKDVVTDYLILHSGEINKEITGSIFTEEEIAKWQAIAFDYNPTIMRKENAMSTAYYEVKTQQGRYVPTLETFVNQASTGSPSFVHQRYTFEAGFELRWELFDGFGRERKICESKFRQESTIWDYEQALIHVNSDVRTRFYEMEEALLSYFASSESVKVAELAVSEAKERLRLGVLTPLDYRDSVTELARAKTDQNRSKNNFIHAYYGLRHAGGIDAADYECIVDTK